IESRHQVRPLTGEIDQPENQREEPSQRVKRHANTHDRSLNAVVTKAIVSPSARTGIASTEKSRPEMIPHPCSLPLRRYAHAVDERDSHSGHPGIGRPHGREEADRPRSRVAARESHDRSPKAPAFIGLRADSRCDQLGLRASKNTAAELDCHFNTELFM